MSNRKQFASKRVTCTWCTVVTASGVFPLTVTNDAAVVVNAVVVVMVAAVVVVVVVVDDELEGASAGPKITFQSLYFIFFKRFMDWSSKVS